jgi:hypothetical protein
MRMRAAPALAVIAALAAGGCGLQIVEPDLFLIRLGGAGRTTTLVVNSAGTIRCDRGRARQISSSQLIFARDLADSLAPLARRHLRLPSPSDSVYRYTVEMAQGTISFPDTAGRRRRVLAQTELFATEEAARFCPTGG